MQKRNAKLFTALFLFVLMSFGTASAQFFSSNARGIYPVGGTNPLFNFNVKFTSLGESGGSPGQTANGCDLYGFRAQYDAVNAVNLGMQRSILQPFPSDAPYVIPTLSFENGSNAGSGISDRFWIQNQKAASPSPFPTLGGCGTLLAYYSEKTGSGSTVYTILGSGLASGGMWNPSDRGLKRNIRPIGSALDMVQKLNGVTYLYNADENPTLNLPTDLQYGFITQEVATVMPTAVRTMDDEFGNQSKHQMMRYDAIIPVLTEAIKEQQSIIEDQQNTIDAQQSIIESFEARLAALESGRKLGPQAEGIELGQNRPNPAGTSTTIDYKLPADIAVADLVIYDMAGRVIDSYPMQSGNNQIKVNTARMTSGTYVYAIVQDGRNIARRKMIIQ
ncbi:MAG: tail fiber domain-containing protein [Bacteroidota bacterium]